MSRISKLPLQNAKITCEDKKLGKLENVQEENAGGDSTLK